MNLMISSPALRVVPAAAHTDAAVDIIACAIGECGLGKVLVARSVKGVCAVLIGDERDELEADLAQRFPGARLVANESVVDDDLAKVIRFVDKPAQGLYLSLDMRGTPFQRRVWERLRTIPVGRTVTYMELARWISPLASPRAWWPALVPPTRSRWPFPATASYAATATWRATAGASSASAR